jgi:hypothetical protein
LTARAIDSNLSEASATHDLTVLNGTAEFTVAVGSVTVIHGRGSRNIGEAVVVARDAGGSPLAGVAIGGSFSGDWSGAVGGQSDGAGEAVLATPAVKNLGFVAFCVDSAAKAAYAPKATAAAAPRAPWRVASASPAPRTAFPTRRSRPTAARPPPPMLSATISSPAFRWAIA